MQKHKWYNEIVAWAMGAEIETRFLYAQVEQTWRVTNAPQFYDVQWEFRIKPQPKEPQYAYAHKNLNGEIYLHDQKEINGWIYAGKIKLEVNDETS